MQVSTTSGEAARSAGQTDVEQSVVEWLRAELDDPAITSSENFLDVGGHSLTFSKLNKFLGESFGVVLDQKSAYGDQLSVAVAAMQPIGPAEPTSRLGSTP